MDSLLSCGPNPYKITPFYISPIPKRSTIQCRKLHEHIMYRKTANNLSHAFQYFLNNEFKEKKVDLSSIKIVEKLSTTTPFNTIKRLEVNIDGNSLFFKVFHKESYTDEDIFTFKEVKYPEGLGKNKPKIYEKSEVSVLVSSEGQLSITQDRLKEKVFGSIFIYPSPNENHKEPNEPKPLIFGKGRIYTPFEVDIKSPDNKALAGIVDKYAREKIDVQMLLNQISEVNKMHGQKRIEIFCTIVNSCHIIREQLEKERPELLPFITISFDTTLYQMGAASSNLTCVAYPWMPFDLQAAHTSPISHPTINLRIIGQTAKLKSTIIENNGWTPEFSKILLKNHAKKASVQKLEAKEYLYFLSQEMNSIAQKETNFIVQRLQKKWDSKTLDENVKMVLLIKLLGCDEESAKAFVSKKAQDLQDLIKNSPLTKKELTIDLFFSELESICSSNSLSNNQKALLSILGFDDKNLPQSSMFPILQSSTSPHKFIFEQLHEQHTMLNDRYTSYLKKAALNSAQEPIKSNDMTVSFEQLISEIESTELIFNTEHTLKFNTDSSISLLDAGMMRGLLQITDLVPDYINNQIDKIADDLKGEICKILTQVFRKNLATHEAVKQLKSLLNTAFAKDADKKDQEITSDNDKLKKLSQLQQEYKPWKEKYHKQIQGLSALCALQEALSKLNFTTSILLDKNSDSTFKKVFQNTNLQEILHLFLPKISLNSSEDSLENVYTNIRTAITEISAILKKNDLTLKDVDTIVSKCSPVSTQPYQILSGKFEEFSLIEQSVSDLESLLSQPPENIIKSCKAVFGECLQNCKTHKEFQAWIKNVSITKKALLFTFIPELTALLAEYERYMEQKKLTNEQTEKFNSIHKQIITIIQKKEESKEPAKVPHTTIFANWIAILSSSKVRSSLFKIFKIKNSNGLLECQEIFTEQRNYNIYNKFSEKALHTLSFQEFKNFFSFNFDEKNAYISLLEKYSSTPGISELKEFLEQLTLNQKEQAKNEKDIALIFDKLKQEKFFKEKIDTQIEITSARAKVFLEKNLSLEELLSQLSKYFQVTTQCSQLLRQPLNILNFNTTINFNELTNAKTTLEQLYTYFELEDTKSAFDNPGKILQTFLERFNQNTNKTTIIRTLNALIHIYKQNFQGALKDEKNFVLFITWLKYHIPFALNGIEADAFTLPENAAFELIAGGFNLKIFLEDFDTINTTLDDKISSINNSINAILGTTYWNFLKTTQENLEIIQKKFSDIKVSNTTLVSDLTKNSLTLKEQYSGFFALSAVKSKPWGTFNQLMEFIKDSSITNLSQLRTEHIRRKLESLDISKQSNEEIELSLKKMLKMMLKLSHLSKNSAEEYNESEIDDYIEKLLTSSNEPFEEIIKNSKKIYNEHPTIISYLLECIQNGAGDKLIKLNLISELSNSIAGLEVFLKNRELNDNSVENAIKQLEENLNKNSISKKLIKKIIDKLSQLEQEKRFFSDPTTPVEAVYHLIEEIKKEITEDDLTSESIEPIRKKRLPKKQRISNENATPQPSTDKSDLNNLYSMLKGSIITFYEKVSSISVQDIKKNIIYLKSVQEQVKGIEIAQDDSQLSKIHYRWYNCSRCEKVFHKIISVLDPSKKTQRKDFQEVLNLFKDMKITLPKISDNRTIRLLCLSTLCPETHAENKEHSSFQKYLISVFNQFAQTKFTRMLDKSTRTKSGTQQAPEEIPLDYKKVFKDWADQSFLGIDIEKIDDNQRNFIVTEFIKQFFEEYNVRILSETIQLPESEEKVIILQEIKKMLIDQSKEELVTHQ